MAKLSMKDLKDNQTIKILQERITELENELATLERARVRNELWKNISGAELRLARMDLEDLTGEASDY